MVQPIRSMYLLQVGFKSEIWDFQLTNQVALFVTTIFQPELLEGIIKFIEAGSPIALARLLDHNNYYGHAMVLHTNCNNY